MSKIVILAVLLFVVSGCKNQDVDTTTAGVVQIYPKSGTGSTTCVKKTKTPGAQRLCGYYWRNDEACFEPGDTITFKWKGNVDQEFEIQPKTGFDSPFVFNDSDCDDAGKIVVCTIRDEVELKNTFFDYAVVVNDDDDCNLDPRILIY